MKAVLMAAGRGSRISKYIGETPKSTLNIEGGPLVTHTVKMLLEHDVAVSIVLGYKKEAVMECLAGLPVSYFYNPFFDVTNSIASLWFARSVIGDDDLIIGNADVYWESDVFAALAQEANDPVMLVDSSRSTEGDYFFKFEGQRLLKYGKDLTGDDISGEYVGIARVKREFQNVLLGRLNALITAQRHSLWWEDVLYSLIEDGRDIYVKDINGMFWSEIDFVEDYERILSYRRQRLTEARLSRTLVGAKS